MKPLILQFKETPKEKELDFSLIEYDSELNLSVDRRTLQPAIDLLSLDTTTMTKAGWEASDSDEDRLNALLDTSTKTYSDSREISHPDQETLNFQNLMDTTTVTLVSSEGIDSDPDVRKMELLLDTSTVTEAKEDTDQDKDWK
jgi:hypothetical protein